MTQDEILEVILKNEGITSKGIKEKTSLAKNTISRELRALEKKKLIKFVKFGCYMKIYSNNIEKR